LTASSLNSIVYACFGIFISCLPKVTSILGHPWQTKFRGKLIVEGDVATAVTQEAFDVVIMVEVLHEIAPEIRPAVVRGCARALRPGGWFVIVDETYPSSLAEARKPEFHFSLQTGLEELMWGNVIPTLQEQEKLLRDAGFAGRIDRSLLGAGFTLLSTQK